MHTRILLGVGAWLLGAIVATGGCLLAVSALGRGIAGTSAQQMTPAAVQRALAVDAAESGTSSPPPVPRRPRSRPPGAPRKHRARHVTRHPAPPPSTNPAPQAKVLTSPGGTVVASCSPAGASLVSESPAQGYDVNSSNLVSGPAATAQVDFESWHGSVTMVVSCRSGVPVATLHVRGGGGGE
jgi:hypothetical protein